MTSTAHDGKPYAGNPHVRFDEGEVASCTAEASLRRVHCRRQPEGRASVCAATPRRGSLLYKKLLIILGAAVMAMCNYTSVAATPASSSSHTLVSAKRGCVASGRSSVAVLHRKERPGMIITFR
jgi:hypothetical protein